MVVFCFVFVLFAKSPEKACTNSVSGDRNFLIVLIMQLTFNVAFLIVVVDCWLTSGRTSGQQTLVPTDRQLPGGDVVYKTSTLLYRITRINRIHP